MLHIDGRMPVNVDTRLKFLEGSATRAVVWGPGEIDGVIWRGKWERGFRG